MTAGMTNVSEWILQRSLIAEEERKTKEQEKEKEKGQNTERRGRRGEEPQAKKEKKDEPKSSSPDAWRGKGYETDDPTDPRYWRRFLE